MNDSVLNEFIDRFGDPEKRKKTKPLESIKEKGLVNLKVPSIDSVTTNPDITSELNNKMASLSNEGDASSFLDKASGVTNKAMGAIAPAMSLISNAKGNQFDTSPDAAEPGNPKGAILQGAMSGAELGKMLGPIGAAGGAAIGGLISTFAHSKAKKEWNQNKKEANLKEDALEKAKRKNEYAQSQGLESLENLKALRKKQLGL